MIMWFARLSLSVAIGIGAVTFLNFDDSDDNFGAPLISFDFYDSISFLDKNRKSSKKIVLSTIRKSS
ncbi:MAG: hypothetical protein EZS28_055474 [Streblomastix strix]|uniref:Uncharacterized protein n=1 Tax=Streblomastix strix TaxID=222440 RepID=A0A5J4Q2C8_9EUKA|nr:MAG: hypothetical protein EZS28_055474 [Streblomastix strix]